MFLLYRDGDHSSCSNTCVNKSAIRVDVDNHFADSSSIGEHLYSINSVFRFHALYYQNIQL